MGEEEKYVQHGRAHNPAVYQESSRKVETCVWDKSYPLSLSLLWKHTQLSFYPTHVRARQWWLQRIYANFGHTHTLILIRICWWQRGTAQKTKPGVFDIRMLYTVERSWLTDPIRRRTYSEQQQHCGNSLLICLVVEFSTTGWSATVCVVHPLWAHWVRYTYTYVDVCA